MSLLTTASMARQLVLAPAVVAALALSSQLLLLAAAADQIGLPGCPTICGNVSVPYPFGITPECSLPGFNLTCDDTSRGMPPRLSFGGDGTLRVTNISLDDATVRVYGPAIEIKLSSDIDAGGGSWGGQAWGLGDGSSAACVLSPAHNELVVTGCGIFTELGTTDYNSVVIGSCGSVCSPGQQYLLQTSSRSCKKCSGIGCCQTAITKAATFYHVRLTAIIGATTPVRPTGTLFVAEEGWFDSRSTGTAINLTAAKFDEDMMTSVPAVLAWMIPPSMLQEPAASEPRDGKATTCTKDTGATVCHSRYSSCTNTTIQTSSSSSEPTYVDKIGYTCKCLDGYKGNPYLIDGCQDAPISLSWRDRLRIAVEIARALTYLHSFVSMPIIHRDIKSANILLDDNLNVKLADFGASRYIPVDQSGVDTVVQGTLGYLDPMYHSTGHLTEKSDVYSFGVLLIELLTRKKPVSYRSVHGYSLTKHFVALISEGKLFDILDPQVSKEGDGEVIDVALLAAICVKLNGEDRPTMRKIEMALESIHASKEYVLISATDDESENWIQVNDATLGEMGIEDACWNE
ncbi:unnamed protein product [Urochloa decumbens]|uniref:Protein kinase domain-containing protein n=1 Tax=Urochloa decumbens TaxID=240449 RepID=A0ABC8VKX4_9POAL